ncbi:MAG: hypothetical protein CMC76_07080 [Flavobacteriaceae bacterium]|nr:hypothetical protein [Flavobacteriaceae bacterium]|tara:strand:+ start:612 stop:3512 length:2901 start_codon:yes stop_codon:yes gene_type:complete
MNKSLLYFFFLCFAINALAQEPAKLHLTEKDGLPDIEFYNIIEDSKRFIWLVADKGLYRYNGKNYQLFTHPSQKGNSVFGPFEDALGRVWCNNISGQFFYVSENTMHHFIDLSEELKGQLAEFIVTDSELIISTRHNIFSVNLETKAIKKNYNKKVEIGKLYKNKTGYIYVEDDKIAKTDLLFKNKQYLPVKIFNNIERPKGISRLINVVENDSLAFYFFSQFNRNNFFRFDVLSGKSQKIKLPKALETRNIVHVFLSNDQIWFSTDSGLYICKLKNQELVLLNTFFSSKYITKVLKDSFNNFWITTKGDGIYIYPNINVLNYNLASADKSVSQIEKLNDSTLIFGTNKGYAGHININNGKVKNIDNTAYRVSNIFYEKPSNVAVISKEDRTLIYNLKNETLTEGANETKGAKDIDFGNGKYSISTYKSFGFIDDALKKIEVVIPKRSYANHFSKKYNAFYNASVDGLFFINENNSVKSIKDNSKAIFVKSIIETKTGAIWVSTFKNGVYQVENDAVVNHLTIDDGLLSNKITQIKGDDNSLWIATEKGIQLFDNTSKTFKTLTMQDGIPSYRIMDIEPVGDNVFFASNEGLFSINKKTTFKTTITPEIYFTAVDVNFKNQELLPKYKLSHNQNSIKIAFNTNGFKSHEHTKYQYRLIGENSKWQTTEDLVNTVNYNGLPSGNYTFQVKIANSNSTVKGINFNIAKPFWRTWWFYGLVGLVLASLLYAFYRRKINKLTREQNAKLQNEMMSRQLVLSQLENLRSQMNPHFIFNALNSIQEYIVLNERDLASSFLIKFSRLMRIYLDHSQQDEVLLSEEINALNIYLELEKNRFEDALDYEIAISKDLKINEIKIPSLFIQPYVENALKHGLLHKKSHRKLDVTFKLDNSKSKFLCIIKDNGIGVEASARLNENRNPQHRSFATSANKKRVELLNHNRKHKIEVVIESKSYVPDSGTTVTIIIPLNR